MTRAEFEHLIGAATTIADVAELVVVGSQAIPGQFPEDPAALLASMDRAGLGSVHLEVGDRE